jgi:hypothetical protein
VALGVLALVAVAARLAEGSGDADFSAANFFSYFTIQSNLIAAAVLLAAGAVALRGRPAGERLDMWRGAATLYIATTGIVYSALLAADAPDLLRWTNLVLHYVMPLAVVADWALDRPRRPIPFRRALVWIAYPGLFLAYTLVRGEIAGWYPYDFLDVADRGYPAVLLTSATISLAMLAAIWLLARTTRGRARDERPAAPV